MRARSRDRVVVACWVVIAALALLMLLGAILAPSDPDQVNLSGALQSPTVEHPFGTDASGRDILSRIMVGARPALGGATLVTIAAVVIGTAIAIGSAWAGGFVDTSTSRLLDLVFAFPGLLLVFLVVAMFGTGFVAPVVALAIVNVPWVARVVRSVAIRERRLPYIVALEAQGFSRPSITGRHLLPNLSRTIKAQAALTFTYALVDLAAINFLGLGLQPPSADWGVMVAEGQTSILSGRPEQSLFAGLFIIIAVLAVSLLSYRTGGDDPGVVRR